MKILLLTDNMHTGGAETHVAALARGLQKMGQEVTLLSSGGAIADLLEQEGIPQIRMPLRQGFPFSLPARRRAASSVIQTVFFTLVNNTAVVAMLTLPGHIEVYRRIFSDRLVHFEAYVFRFVRKIHIPKAMRFL